MRGIVTRLARVACLLLLVLSFMPASAADSGSSAPSVDQAFRYRVSYPGDDLILIHWQIAKGTYLYRKRVTVKGLGGDIDSIDKPPGKLVDIPFFGKERIYRHGVTIRVHRGEATALRLSWQGCAAAGICYPPQHDLIDLQGTNADRPGVAPTMRVAGQRSLQTQDPPALAISKGQSQTLAGRLSSDGWLPGLAIFFALGVLLAFTPCVLPMLPILSATIVGTEARGWRSLALSIAFVVPMSLTYAGLGIAAALAGSNVQAMLEKPWLIALYSLVFVLLSLSMFGLYDLQLPVAIRDRFQRIGAGRRSGSLIGAALIGVSSAALVSPCVTAPLAGALLYIAHSGNWIMGGLTLFALGLGMGLPLVVISVIGAQFLPRPGYWMNVVKTGFGFALLAMAIWLLSRFLVGSVSLFLYAVLILAIGVSLSRLRWNADLSAFAAIFVATASLVTILWGGAMMMGAGAGETDPLHPLAFLTRSSDSRSIQDAATYSKAVRVDTLAGLKAALSQADRENRWAIVDVTAQWCTSCQVMDRTVFGRDEVRRALSDAMLIRVDVTDGTPAEREIMSRYEVAGPPTILFFSPSGQLMNGTALVGEVSARKFLDRFESIARQAG